MVGEQGTSTGLPLCTNITFLQNSQEALQQISLNAICVNQAIFYFLTKKIYFTWDHVKKWEFYLSFSERIHGYVFWDSFSEQWSIRLGRLSDMTIQYFYPENWNATTQIHIPAFVLNIHHGLHYLIKIIAAIILKVHKIENFFGFDFEICTFS
jgi:hypothetical protein